MGGWEYSEIRSAEAAEKILFYGLYRPEMLHAPFAMTVFAIKKQIRLQRSGQPAAGRESATIFAIFKFKFTAMQLHNTHHDI